jgi:hypothetical protein
MTDPIGPVERSLRPRRVGRRPGATGRRKSDKSSTLPAPIEAAAEDLAPPPPAGPAAYAAQVMGQGGLKRGLRGGPETIDRARSAYLEAEWSGPSDRRIARGRITKTEI